MEKKTNVKRNYENEVKQLTKDITNTLKKGLRKNGEIALPCAIPFHANGYYIVNDMYDLANKMKINKVALSADNKIKVFDTNSNEWFVFQKIDFDEAYQLWKMLHTTKPAIF